MQRVTPLLKILKESIFVPIKRFRDYIPLMNKCREVISGLRAQLIQEIREVESCVGDIHECIVENGVVLNTVQSQEMPNF